MGFQTTLIIRNDAIGDIRDNPTEFVGNLLRAIGEVSGTKGLDIPCGHHANVARVVEVHHSDSTTVIASGGSTAELLTTVHRWRWSNEQDKLDSLILALVDAKVELQQKERSK
jgi:hypothetical protein